MSKWNLNLDSSSDEVVGEQLSLSHLKVDEVHKPNFWDHSPPTLLTLGAPGVENHVPKFGTTNYSSSTQSDSQQPQQRKIMTRPCHKILDRESKGKKRKCGEDLVSEFDYYSCYYQANGSGLTSRRNEDGLQQCSKASSVEMHKMSERKRRDRIAKKVKALEELIPNCNKVMSMDGFPAWHSTSTLLAARNQIMQSTLQFNPYVPVMPRIAFDSYFGFGTSINYSNMLSPNLFPMMPLPSTGSHFPFLPLASITRKT
ncbi:uncharacterized protein LOC132613248 [Lycium barbarum]|uniref:uncharacterized protein LOC132613248 n=1 Tax=Lycium barbarum TaxID=112863 RepID=UPI00293EF7BC|nr:uncharacterized protein LOC132613248 [Lycium barbarum]